MNLDNARGLKQQFLNITLPALTATASTIPRSSILSRSLRSARHEAVAVPIVGVGIAPKAQGRGFDVALRLQDQALIGSPTVQRFIRQAHGEVDVRVVGRVYALSVPLYQQRVRPLQPGISIGHCDITAGTLGCFVRKRSGSDTRTRILSNNHVLANVNRGRIGDPILQPGKTDKGAEPDDVVAKLETYKRILFTGSNEVDAALAIVEEDIEIDPAALREIGQLRGLAAADRLFEERLTVQKLGRTTGHRQGIITAAELVIPYGVSFGEGRVVMFHNQIEIQSSTQLPFSRGGDSGSLVVTTEGHEAIGLLFAGTDAGGSNGLGLTYANPIHTVLDGFRVDLVTA